MRVLRPARLILPIASWPEQDQALWHAGCHPGDDLDAPLYGTQRRPKTLANAAKGWGRFLAVLAQEGGLDPEVLPAARVTRAAVRRFVTALQAQGNKGQTTAARLFELRAALRLMQPDTAKRFAWLVRPANMCAWTALSGTSRTFPVFHSADLYRWGLGMMDEASLALDKPANRRAYRNGLIIAIFAARGLRERSLAGLRLGEQITRTDTEWRITLEPKDTKNRRSVRYALPESLTLYLDRYVDQIRPSFAATPAETALWLTETGRPLGQAGISSMIRRTSRALHPPGFGTHTFRRSYGTTAPLANPTHATATAAVLAIGQATAENAYNMGNTVLAAQAYQEAIGRLRSKDV